MAITRLKATANFRATPVHTSTPEPIEIEGGVALLAEAPADPGSQSWPMTVMVNGSPRTRVTTTPAAGQFRVMTQTVIGANGQAVNEFLPLLQFHASDEGLAGTCDYWQSGSVLTSQFFTTLVSFLTPLTGYASPDLLPTPTTAATNRGRTGDVAFLEDGSCYFSTGAEWRPIAGSNYLALQGPLTLGAAIGLASDAGYVGPSLTGDHSFAASQAFAADASFAALSAWTGAFELGAVLGLTMDAVAAHVGAHSYGQSFGIDLDATWAGPSLTGGLTLGQSIAMSLDATYAGGSSALAVTDLFERTTLADGTHPWSAPNGVTPPAISGGWLLQTTAVRAAYWNATTAANQYASVDTQIADYVGVSVRMQASGDTCYWLARQWDGDVGNPFLYRVVSGVATQLGYGAAALVGGVLRLEISGTTLTVKEGATTLFTFNDATWLAAHPGVLDSGYTGVRLGAYYEDGIGLGNWSGGDL